MGSYNIPHRFDVKRLLYAVIGYKGLFYPGIFINWMRLDPTEMGLKGRDYTILTEQNLKTHTALGTPIRKRDAMGRLYFMPVILKSADTQIELPNAVISLKGSKTIVSTDLPGANGSVKELISLDDYEIDIAAVAIGSDGNYPEEEIEEINKLWRLNESISLISAVTDLVIGQEARIVLKTMDVPEVGAIEDAQIIRFTAVTDSQIELIID